MIKKWQQEFLNISLKIRKKFMYYDVFWVSYLIFYILYSENMKLIFRGPNWASSVWFDAETDI